MSNELELSACTAPDAAVPVRALFYLVEVILLNPVRRVGHDGVQAVFGNAAQPLPNCYLEVLARDNLSLGPGPLPYPEKHHGMLAGNRKRPAKKKVG